MWHVNCWLEVAMSHSGKEIGCIGEGLAVEYLRAHGFRIIERNYRCRIGEIDIVARKRNELYFVEVKTRKGERYGSPLESITSRKQRQIIKIAKYFLFRVRHPVNCHFSVAGVLIEEGALPKVAFIADAFET